MTCEHCGRGPLDEILLVPEIAVKFGVKERAVQRACQEGLLPSTRRFGKYVVVRRLLLKLLEEESLGLLDANAPDR